jgi:hypothetical protein
MFIARLAGSDGLRMRSGCEQTSVVRRNPCVDAISFWQNPQGVDDHAKANLLVAGRCGTRGRCRGWIGGGRVTFVELAFGIPLHVAHYGPARAADHGACSSSAPDVHGAGSDPARADDDRACPSIPASDHSACPCPARDSGARAPYRDDAAADDTESGSATGRDVTAPEPEWATERWWRW